MFKLHRILLAGAILAMATTASQAGGMPAGTIGGLFDVVGLNNGPLLKNATLIKPHVNLVNGTDDLTGFSANGNLSLDLNNLTGFTMSFTSGSDTLAFGSVSSVSSNTPMTGPPTFLNIAMLGTATVNGQNVGALLTWTFNQSSSNALPGGYLSLTLMPIPEPSSIALAGIGMAAAGLFGLRKRYAK